MSEHQKPAEDSECLICCNEITDANYVEFQVSGDTKWYPCIICEVCTEELIKDMMPTYLKNLLEADCRASQLRVLAEGPPIYIKESSIFPCPEGEHVDKLWYSSTQQEKSAKVEGCLEGEAREKWWNEMKEILSLTEQEIKEKEEMFGKPSK